jgi:hypothetical protein
VLQGGQQSHQLQCHQVSLYFNGVTYFLLFLLEQSFFYILGPTGKPIEQQKLEFEAKSARDAAW